MNPPMRFRDDPTMPPEAATLLRALPAPKQPSALQRARMAKAVDRIEAGARRRVISARTVGSGLLLLSVAAALLLTLLRRPSRAPMQVTAPTPTSSPSALPTPSERSTATAPRVQPEPAAPLPLAPLLARPAEAQSVLPAAPQSVPHRLRRATTADRTSRPRNGMQAGQRRSLPTHRTVVTVE